MTLKHAIDRLTAKIEKREWDSGFIWIHGQTNPIPINSKVLARFLPLDECIEIMVGDVYDPFDEPYPARQNEQGQIVPENPGSLADGWTYIAIDAINRIDLFQSKGKIQAKKIVEPPPGMQIIK